jgi:hypothetical protein
MLMVASYLNQQKDFVCGLFDPPNSKANVIVRSELVENLGILSCLVVVIGKDTK